MIRLKSLITEEGKPQGGVWRNLAGYGPTWIESVNSMEKTAIVRLKAPSGFSKRMKVPLERIDWNTKPPFNAKSQVSQEAQSQQKPAPQSWSSDQRSYDWRTQSKGSHWKSTDGKWGARAQSGEVDYFPDEETAKKFSQHAHTGKPGTYVSGQFGKGN